MIFERKRDWKGEMKAIFYFLAFIGIIDFIIQAISSGKIKLVQSILHLLFE